MKIEQALHGYNQGHTLLASSINLMSQKDRKKMAILSDWTEYSRTDDEDLSYISAYPLQESSYYVVAKTWYADEKERPGSVWTHSLILNIDNIDVFFDLRLLYDLFRRPEEKNGFSKYNETIELESDQSRETKLLTEGLHIPSLTYWLERLIVNHDNLVFSISESTYFNQAFILILMSHLPEGFWSKMSFCSGSGRVRQYEDKMFDLQFISSIRNKYPTLAKEIKEKNSKEWITLVSKSILEEDKGISILLKKFSNDIEKNINRFQTVIEVYSELDRLNKPSKENIPIFENVLIKIASAFPQPIDGYLFKKSILSDGLTRYFFEEDIFIYIMASTVYSKSFDYAAFDFVKRAEEYIKEHTLLEILSIIDKLLLSPTTNEYKDIILKMGIQSYNTEQIKYIYKEHWMFYKYLAEKTPSILANDIWLDADEKQFCDILNIFTNQRNTSFSNWGQLLRKIIKNKYKIQNEIISILSLNYTDLIKDILDAVNQGILVQKELIEYSKKSPIQIVKWIKFQRSINKQTTRIILDSISPKSEVINTSTSKDWLPMMDADADDITELNVFLFILSYNWLHDDVSFNIYKKAFMPIYEIIAANKLNDKLWEQIAGYCPRPFLGWEWDRCKLLRKGFAERFIYEKREIEEIKTFTPYRILNKKLMKAVRDKYKHRE